MLQGKKTYIAAVLLLAYQVSTGDLASAMGTFNAVVGPLVMLLMRKVTKTPPAI